MTRVHKNIISFLLGCLFSYLFLWVSGVGAAAPVPELLRTYSDFSVSYYSNLVIMITAAILASPIMLVVRKTFTFFTKENLFYFALPIVLFLIVILIFMSFAVSPLLYAAVPTLVVAALLTNRVKKI